MQLSRELAEDGTFPYEQYVIDRLVSCQLVSLGNLVLVSAAQ